MPCTAAITGTASARQPQATCWTHVEPCAEAAALAREHHRAQPRRLAQLGDRVDDPVEHRRVERVELVGPGEAHIGDSGLDGDGDSCFAQSFSLPKIDASPPRPGKA
jgi:hypothetical protein